MKLPTLQPVIYSSYSATSSEKAPLVEAQPVSSHEEMPRAEVHSRTETSASSPAIPLYEIVTVVSGAHLIDSESKKQSYITFDGRPLPPGDYIVLWPSDAKEREYHGKAKYFGPLKSTLVARLMLWRCLQEYRANADVPLAVYLADRQSVTD
jgi:hypothetical protein